MNPDAVVTCGLPPWAPSSRARNINAVHAWDVPLIGTFDLDGSTILFACLTGAMSSISAWGYVPVSRVEAKELAVLPADTTADLEAFVHGMFVGRVATLALANEDAIYTWTTDSVDESGVLEACTRFMDLEIHRLKSDHDQARRAEQARADATRRVLELEPEPEPV